MPAVDELSRGAERLVLVSDRAVRLVGLAPAILDLTEDWCDLAALAAALESRFGPPPGGGADELLQIAVSALAAEGLVEVAEP